MSGPRSDTRPLFFGYFVKFCAQIDKKSKKNEKKMQKNVKKFAYIKKKQYLCTVI